MSVYLLDDQEVCILVTFAAQNGLVDEASAPRLAGQVREDSFNAFVAHYGDVPALPPLTFDWSAAEPDRVFDLAGRFLYNAAPPEGRMYELMRAIRKVAAAMMARPPR